MKKLLCMLLCVCLICPFAAGVLTAAEALAASAETVLFTDNFEAGYTVGQNITFASNTVNRWSYRVDSATSKIRAATDAERGIVAEYSNTAEKSGGPRLHKTLYCVTPLTNMTVSYKIKTVNANISLSLSYADGKEQSIYSANSTNAWSDVKVVFDFNANTATPYLNGTKGSVKTLSAADRTTITVRISTSIVAGQYAYLDDVVVSTTDDVNVEDCNNVEIGLRTPEEIIAPYLGYPHAPSISVPQDKYEMFTYDCTLNANNGISTGTDALWSGLSDASQAILNADDTNNGKIIRFTNSKRLNAQASLYKKLTSGTDVKEITAEHYVVFSESSLYFELKDGNKNVLIDTKAYALSASTAGATENAWNKVKVVFDLEHSLCDVYINDTAVATDIAFTNTCPEGNYETILYIHGALAPADTMLLDNFVMYQDAAPVLTNVKYYGTTGTNWELVATDVVLTEDSFVNNLRQHPRLMVNDRDALLEKIASDPRVAAWYESVKVSADNILKQELVAYSYGNGRNILEPARKIGERLWVLSMLYLVEKDDKYVERAIAEMRNAGEYPDWSNNAPIIPSEIMLGFAGFYDWCYDSPLMTDEVKAEMVQIIKDQALWQFVRSYENEISAEIAKGTSNRTTVANSAAGLLALAIADEYPQLSQFLLDKALYCMMQAINVYGNDGAYPEGATYWGYPMRTLIPFMSSLETSVRDGYTLPANAQWYFDNEAIANTNDYWAYISGPIYNFDFGDASLGLSTTSPIIWNAQRTNDPFMLWYLNHIAAKNNSSVSNKVFALPWYDPDFKAYNDGTMPLDKTFDDADTAQIASMRSSWATENALYAAMQGGYNGTGHMFKSLGTFVLDANGQRFVRTIGRSNYSALYSPYMYYNERAEGQNTIIANPGLEFDQETKAVARFVRHEEAQNEAFTILDMTETNKAFTDAKRGMYMTKGRRSVVLQDEITTNTPSEIWWFAHTDADVTIAEDGKSAMMYLNGERMFVRITEGPEDAQLTMMDARPLPTSPVAPDEVYDTCGKLAIHLSEITELTLAVEFIPLNAKEAAPSTYTPVKAMKDWSVSDNTIPVNRQAGANLVMLAGSPNYLALEEKKMINENNAAVVPYIENGTYYVPAIAAGEAFYATVTATASVVKVQSLDLSQEIREGLVQKNGTIYVTAEAMAAALGKVLSIDGDMLVMSDIPVNYTQATKDAIRTQLATRVMIAGKDFADFDVDKTNYELRYDTTMPLVRIADGTKVTKKGNVSTFVLNGKTYTVTFVKDAFKPAMQNVVLGITPTASVQMGNSFVIENMTNGLIGAGTSAAAATIGTKISNVTFEIDFGRSCLIDTIELYDEQTSAGSTMDKATWYAKTTDGEWVQIGVHEELTKGDLSSKTRINTLTVADQKEYTALRVNLVDTDGYRQRYYIYELVVLGAPSMSALDSYTYTTFETVDDKLVFTTEAVNFTTDGLMAVVLYKEGAQVAMKLLNYAKEAVIETIFDLVDFDAAKVILLDSFFNLKVLCEPEALEK